MDLINIFEPFFLYFYLIDWCFNLLTAEVTICNFHENFKKKAITLLQKKKTKAFL